MGLRQSRLMTKSYRSKILLGLTVAFGLTATASAQMMINGAGATFPYPIYSKWFDEYAKVDPSVRFNYQSIGSGGGQKQIMAQTVDFGASDGPMSDDNLSKAPGKILHIPTVAGAVVITYNLEGNPTLKLDADTIAGIFLGQIKKWNDPKIAALNPGVSLPDKEIVVVHRSDGSGTTYIFTDYLSKVSPDWKSKVGTNTPGKESYPIAGATWLLIYQQQKDAAKGKKLVEFLKWAETKGEQMAKDLDYAPLPKNLEERILKRIDEIKY